MNFEQLFKMLKPGGDVGSADCTRTKPVKAAIRVNVPH